MRFGWRPYVLAAAVASVGCGSHGTFYESLNPAMGRPSGGEEVRLRGSGFGALGNIEIRVGGKLATNVGIADDETIVFTTPEAREDDVGHALPVYILTNTGRSIVLRDAFTYRSNGNGSGASGLGRRL